MKFNPSYSDSLARHQANQGDDLHSELKNRLSMVEAKTFQENLPSIDSGTKIIRIQNWNAYVHSNDRVTNLAYWNECFSFPEVSVITYPPNKTLW